MSLGLCFVKCSMTIDDLARRWLDAMVYECITYICANNLYRF